MNDCRTHWDSTFLMIARLLEINDHVSEVADEILPDMSLSPIQWNHPEIIRTLQEPFAHHTNIESADKSTIAMVIPILKELEFHLNEVRIVPQSILCIIKFRVPYI